MKRRPTYQVTPQAELDIEEVVQYISLDNPTAALMMLERFYDAFRLLAENPSIGHTRADLTGQDVRFWNVKPRYHVIYSTQFQPLMIVRVLPADMDIAREMSSTIIS